MQPLVVLLLGAMVGYLGFPASGTCQLKVLRFALAGSQGGHSLDSGGGLPSFFLRLVPGLRFEGVALISLCLGVEMGKDYLFLFGWLSQQMAAS